VRAAGTVPGGVCLDGGMADEGRSADELLDIVDEEDRVVGRAPRGEAYRRRLRHRCVFIRVRDPQGRIFVHRRTPEKLIFPSRYDMFVGGVVGAGERYDEAALREAEEELGVSGLPQPVPVLKFLYETPEHSWWSKVYEVECALPVNPQAEEVAWHTFLTDAELESRLPEWEWVPDGLAAYHELRGAHGTAARDGSVRDSAAPGGSAPQESAPQESAPQESAPQESAPQESAPRESAPEDGVGG
jgi:8-oxo-dGTP pyrophosphatase MutT (NUDIX family)